MIFRTAIFCAPAVMFITACGADNTTIENESEGQSGLSFSSRFYVPPPDSVAVQQVKELFQSKSRLDAARVASLIATPRAVWFTGGAPSDVKAAVQKTMNAAACEHRVPLLVAYNLPYRDCSQYSAGGAADTATYDDWIDAFAAGIGKGEAMVILEPDSLGIIPYNTSLDGSSDWCQPTVTDAQGSSAPAPGANPSERYAQLNHAVDSIKSLAPNAKTYLDGTNSAWLNVGEAAYRLTTAGVARVQGFFLNVSNYQFSANLAQYGSWVANCLAYVTAVTPGDFGGCPTQYWNGGPLPSKIAQINGEWTGVGLDSNGQWSDTTDVISLNTSGINLRYANMLGTTPVSAHFVIDSGRNGQGPLNTAPYAAAPYNQSASVLSGLQSGYWCNAYGAGAGLRPTVRTGQAMLDAYLWVKVPGESDGSCDIAGGARAWDFTAYNPWNLAVDAQSRFDPLWGLVDPAAGKWFGAQALQLAQLANPPLL